MKEKTYRPQLHVSMLDMLSRCGCQFQRRYGARFGVWHKEEIIPPGIALGVGISVHKSVENNLTYKLQTKELLPREQIADIARDSFLHTWDGGMLLTEDESLNVDKTKGEAIDLSVKLSNLHYDTFAPVIEPISIEEKFVIILDGYPIDLAGKKDIVEEKAIGDVKTRANTPPDSVVKSMQMAMYSLDHKIKTTAYPERVYHQYLIKTKTPKALVREAKPDDGWINPLLRRVERFVEIIEAVKAGRQAFTPADPESFVCQGKYCGYSKTCEFWSGRP